MEIQDYPNYLIYETGEVFNDKTNRFKKKVFSNDGYLIVNLHKNAKGKNFYIHRLVAIHYIPNPENKPQVDHIDGNKTNNCVENLRWVTGSENCNAFKKMPKHNTSGVKNISFHKQIDRWIYRKTKYKKTHQKCFKTFEEACEYKRNYELT